MLAPSNDLLLDIEKSLSIPRFDVVRPLPNEASVVDSTRKYILRQGAAQWILIVSSPASPLTVHRAIDRQRLAISALQGDAAEAIEMPLTSGFYGECSYALWQMRQPFSSNRILFKIEKLRLMPIVYWWVRELAAQTVGPASPSTLAANAQRLCEVSKMPATIKQAADEASSAFISGRIAAIQLLQHSDLWIGNILKAPTATGFIVIDWPGARLDGVPFFDLVKLAVSVRASKATLRKQIEDHSSILNCNPADGLSYVLSGLGQLHSELEHFSESSFISLCQRKFDVFCSVR